MFTLLFFLSIGLVGSGFGDLILSSPQVTNWGRWGEWEYCPEHTYVVGMQLRTESYQGVFTDDTALNGVKFFCDHIGNRSEVNAITSSLENWGSFGNKYWCHDHGVVTGFQLKSEKSQSAFSDDTAANNLKVFCNGGLNKPLEGDGERHGDWTHPQECFQKQAVCGISTQVEADSNTADETALNNIKVKCCEVEDPAKECEPEDKWELIIECDNLEAVSPTTCSYERKVGISETNMESEHHTSRSIVYREIGFDLAGASSVLAYGFRTKLGHSSLTGFDWTSATTETWSVETTTKVSFDVPPGIRTQLLQTIGTCDFYLAKSTRVKRVDYDSTTKTETITFIDI